MKRKLNPNEAMLLFKDSLTNHIAGIIGNSSDLYEDELSLENLGKVRLFPWVDWPLFLTMKEKGLLSNDNKLHSIPLIDVVNSYNRFYDDLKGNLHTRYIECLKTNMRLEGYKNTIPNFILFEREKPTILYSSDGHHRCIAYQSLLKEGMEYAPVDCVFAQIESIDTAFSGVRHLVL